MVKNLTEGRPLNLLFFFALPMVAGNLFQQLYNMVDTAVVGKFVGEDAVAAVGSSFPIVFLSVAVASGLSMGCTVVVSQLFGAGRIHEMKTTISTAIISLGVLGLLIMGLGTLLAGPLLQLLGTDPDIMADSRTYLQIYFGGAVFLFLYNTLNGIYNAQGDSKTPLIFLMISSLTNIVLDLLFVIRFGMGVAGVAWATLIAQGLCAVASLLVLLRRMRRMPCEPEKQGVKLPLFHMVAVKRIAQIGLPSMLQQSLVSLSMMMMQGLVNSFGKVLVAGYTAATKIDSLAMLPNMNISNAMSSFTAQNIGAGKYERVKEGLKACLLMVAVFSLLITVIIFLFGNQLLSLFLDPGSGLYAHSLPLLYPDGPAVRPQRDAAGRG
jgi:putative MATE family efflux protein